MSIPDNSSGPEFQYVSIAEAAVLLGVHRSAIYQAVEAGCLHTVHLMGKQALLRADVLAYTPRPNAKRKSGGAHAT